MKMETVLFSLPTIVALPAIPPFKIGNFVFLRLQMKGKLTEHEF